MKRAGQIILTLFPHTHLEGAKLRPALMLRQASPRFDDWLVCMILSQLRQAELGFDEILTFSDPDFADSGLKVPSVLRLKRLAVLDGALLEGVIGNVSGERLQRIRRRLADWIRSSES